MAIFSFIALIVGLAAALKLSAFVANRLKESVNLSAKWLPFLSFIIIFLVVVFVVHLGGKLIEKTFQMALLGWVNRLAGIILYAIIYLIIFSVFLFYAEKIHLFSATTFQVSHTWSFLKPFGPEVIDGFAKVAPVFKDMFKELEDFFASLPQKVAG